MHKQLIVGNDTDDSPLNELSRKLASEETSIKVPKMQVTEKDGKMFALNNSLLQLMRQLEKQDKLQHGLIQVEMVPLSKVPTNIQMGMIADIDSSISDDRSSDDQLYSIDKYQPDSSKNWVKKRMDQKVETENKTISAQESSQTNINQTSDEESDHEDDDEEDEEEPDDHEERSSGSSTSDETMQCNVCDHTFSSARLLAKHQLKKKHFGCSVCDTVFPSLKALEEHKETLEHWSDDDNPLTEDENDQYTIKPQREELERLL